MMRGARIMLAEIELFAKCHRSEEGYKVPKDKMNMSKPYKIMDFIEEWTGDHYSVICSEFEQPDERVDATFGKADSCYGIPRDKIEERTLHGAPALTKVVQGRLRLCINGISTISLPYPVYYGEYCEQIKNEE
jgi:hypothetical protein